MEKLWKLLSDRFAGQNLTEKYRTELRNRRRKPGESLDGLCQDIRRLLILAYPGPTSSAHEAIAKDSFIDALSSELSLKIRERDPLSLDSALHIALRLEAIYQAAETRDVNDDSGCNKGRVRGVIAGQNQSSNDVILAKLKEMQAQFSSEMKAFGGRLDNVESTMRRHQQNEQPRSTQISQGPMSATTQRLHNERVNASNQHGEAPASTTTFQSASQRSCYICGDPTHLMRQCPNARDARRSHQMSPTNNNMFSVGGQSQRDEPDAAARGSHGQLDNGHVYLIIHMDRRKYFALLDSGCELSLAPTNIVGK